MEFYNPVRIVAGTGSCSALPAYIGRICRGGNILLLTRGLDFLKSGAYGAVKKALDGYEIVEESLSVSNPDVADMAALMERVRQKPYGLIVAVGGGSVMDTAKTLALALPAHISGTAQLRRFITDGCYDGISPIPWIGIPTTAGTGAEVTPWATVWDREQSCKLSCSSAKNFAAMAVVDPIFTLTCPLSLSVSSALDAVCHSAESFWARHTNEISQHFALLAIGLIRRHLEELTHRLDDVALRLAVAKASTYAGLAFSNTKTTVCHSVSYPMTEKFGVPHGTAAALTLGDFLAFNKEAVSRYDELLGAFGCHSAGEVKDWIFRMLRLGGFPVQLREYGIARKDLGYIVDHAFTKGRADNNPVTVVPDDVRRLLERLF